MEQQAVRVVRHNSEHGRWELVERAPDPRLRGLVADYEGYVEWGTPAPVHRQQVPTTWLPLIVNLGSAWNVADSADGDGLQRLDSFFAGLFDRSAFVAAEGPASCVQVNLTPLAARMLLGHPMHELANRTVDLGDVLPATARHLPERIASAETWEDRFAVLDDLLLRAFADARRPEPEVDWAWRMLVRSRGRVRVGALADHLGRSRRHLVARFREHIGLPPKTVARILRFNSATKVLQGRSGVDFAELAYECGYYDQAHLSRDFREFAGVPPGAFARRLDPEAGLLVQ